MGKTFCAYHPTVPASWYCDACGAYYCSECISRRDINGMGKKTTMHLCPKCSCVSEKLAVQNIIEPFWNRMPKFFTYPFTPPVIVFMLAVAGLTAVFAIPSLLSFFIMLFIISAPLKFCFAVLKETARGSMLPPKIDEHILTGDIFIVFKYWLMFIVLGALSAVFIGFCFRLAFTASPQVAAGIIGLYAIGLMFIVPAMIIVFATTESLINALNPFVFLRMAFRIGKSYFLMFLLLLFLYGAPGVVAYFAKPYLPELLFTFIVALANIYYTIVMHNLMGYVVLQHHEDIGYEVDVNDDEMERISGKARSRDTGHALLNRVNIFVKDGKYAEAVKLVQDETGGDTGSLELAERYHNLLKMTGKTPEMLEHAGRYLEMLIKAKKETAYRTLYLECVAADPKFNPQASVLFRVASSLSETGNSQAALEAYNRFIQACPDDPMTPKAYLLAAQVFHEKMLSPDRAVKTLKRLIKSYPDHEIIGYATKYLRKLEQEG